MIDITPYLPYTRTQIHKWAQKCPSEINKNDLQSAGYWGLFQAARSFDSTKHTAFTSWAYVHINRAMIDEIRQITQCDHLSPPQLTPITPLIMEEMPSPSVSVEEVLVEEGRRKEMWRIIDTLPKRLSLLAHRLAKGETQKEIALSEHITPARVSQLVNNMKRRVRKKGRNDA